MEKTAKGGSRRPAMRGARVARAPVSTLPAVDIAEATATEAGDVDTFSDDLTPAQLSARPLQPGPPRKASSQNQYDKTANKHWTNFCKAAGWDAVPTLRQTCHLHTRRRPRARDFMQQQQLRVLQLVKRESNFMSCLTRRRRLHSCGRSILLGLMAVLRSRS